MMTWGVMDCFVSVSHCFMGVSVCWIHSKMQLDAAYLLYLCVFAMRYRTYSKPVCSNTTILRTILLLLLMYQYCYCFVLISTLQFHIQFLHPNMQTRLRLTHNWFTLQRQMQSKIISVALITAKCKNYTFSLITSKFPAKRECFKGTWLMVHFSGIHSVSVKVE